MKKLTIKALVFLLMPWLFAACSSDSDGNFAPSGSTSTSGTTSGSKSPEVGLGNNGKGGSMARFAISDNTLYTVGNTNLKTYNIANPSKPVYQTETPLAFGIETVYPYKNRLYIGSNNGMFIFDITNPSSPQFISNYQHIFSCDPVVVNDQYAFVTLRSGSNCRMGVNRLEVVDIRNAQNPVLIREYPMDNPYGVGIDGNKLFVCDEGLKLYDATDVNNLTLTTKFNVKAFDVIPYNGHLMLIGEDGLYQYSYSTSTIKQLSHIKITPTL
jgi:hypothetical protein